MNQTKELVNKMVSDIIYRTYDDKNKDFQIKSIDDALVIFKKLKEYEKRLNEKEFSKNGKIVTEWKFVLEDLKNWFNEDKDLTKTKTYMIHQSLVVNSLFLNKEYFNQEWILKRR